MKYVNSDSLKRKNSKGVSLVHLCTWYTAPPKDVSNKSEKKLLITLLLGEVLFSVVPVNVSVSFFGSKEIVLKVHITQFKKNYIKLF